MSDLNGHHVDNETPDRAFADESSGVSPLARLDAPREPLEA